MADLYGVHEFRVVSAPAALSEMVLRVHAPSREEAWRRIVQMHPRATEVKDRLRSGCEFRHASAEIITNITN